MHFCPAKERELALFRATVLAKFEFLVLFQAYLTTIGWLKTRLK